MKIGNWGSFSITLSTTSADTKEALTARNIKAVNANFQPDDDFKAELQKTDFVWVDKLAAGRSASAGGITPSEPEEGGNTSGGGDGDLEENPLG